MDRDELIRTASREAASILVFTDPDTKGQIRSTSDLIAERIIDAIEPMIRGDGVAKYGEMWRGAHEQYRRDLRAGVKALRDYKRIEGDGVDALVWRSEVLAMIDGEGE